MKKLPLFFMALAGLMSLASCSKTESDFTAPVAETITISAGSNTVAAGTAVSFRVLSSLNNSDVTAVSSIYVNGTLITGSTYTFNAAGTYAVYAAKGGINSNVISIEAVVVTAGYKHKVLIEEYSGTWCGNCPRLLYGVDLLHQQTDKAVTVGVHLFNGDPFITTDGNNLAAANGVSGVPDGRINRTTSWTGPQYQNVNQVINTIQASSNAGLAINSANSAGNLTISVKTSLLQAAAGSLKLNVYLVEDNLLSTQANYSSNLYGGTSSISSFEYDGVLRKIISALSGDAVAASAGIAEKNYTLSVPANVSNMANAKIVAFITDNAGMVLNVQSAAVGENKLFESL